MRNGLQAAKRFEAVYAGKPHVAKDYFEIGARGTFERFFGGFGGLDVIALVAEDGRERFADAGFVVNDENVWMRRHAKSCRIQGTARGRSVAKERQCRCQRKGVRQTGCTPVVFGKACASH